MKLENNYNFIDSLINEHLESVNNLKKNNISITDKIAQLMITCLTNGGKIIWMGNGGSAADSQHMAAEFVGRFKKERKGFPSIALTTDTSILTAVANDYGYDAVFERQIEALCNPVDIVVGITTSGNSRNIISAIEKANSIGAKTIGFTGKNECQIEKSVNLCLKVPSSNTARIQEMHILCGHIICELVENTLFNE